MSCVKFSHAIPNNPEPSTPRKNNRSGLSHAIRNAENSSAVYKAVDKGVIRPRSNRSHSEHLRQIKRLGLRRLIKPPKRLRR
jgi:hypothetical protein